MKVVKIKIIGMIENILHKIVNCKIVNYKMKIDYTSKIYIIFFIKKEKIKKIFEGCFKKIKEMIERHDSILI